MADNQLRVHVFRIRTLNNYKYYGKAKLLFDKVMEKQAQWEADCSRDVLAQFYVLQTEIYETWFSHSKSIKVIEDKLMPLCKDDSQAYLHAKYLLAKACCFGSRFYKGYHLVLEIIENESHSVEDRIMANINLSYLYQRIDCRSNAKESLKHARDLICKHQEQLGENSEYYELICQFEECRCYRVFDLNYKYSQDELKIYTYNLTPFLKISQNIFEYSNMKQNIDDLIPTLSNEDLLDMLNPIQFCSLFIKLESMLAFYKALKEDTHQCQRENQDWFTKTKLDPSKWYFLIHSVISLYYFNQQGYDSLESREATAFLKYHSQFKGVLENSYLFQSLKVNLDRSESFVSRQLKNFEVYSLFYDNDEADMAINKAFFILSTLSMIQYFQSFTNYIYI